MKAPLLILSAFLFGAPPALAIDPGVAKGVLQTGGATVELTHAYALLANPRELRILLADREVLQSTLNDSAHLPAVMARQGQLRGLMIQVDPENTGQSIITVLHTVVRSGNGGPVVRRLSIAHNRVTGEIDGAGPGAPKDEYRATFSAPLFTNPNPVAPKGVNRP